MTKPKFKIGDFVKYTDTRWIIDGIGIIIKILKHDNYYQKYRVNWIYVLPESNINLYKDMIDLNYSVHSEENLELLNKGSNNAYT